MDDRRHGESRGTELGLQAASLATTAPVMREMNGHGIEPVQPPTVSSYLASRAVVRPSRPGRPSALVA